MRPRRTESTGAIDSQPSGRDDRFPRLVFGGLCLVSVTCLAIGLGGLVVVGGATTGGAGTATLVLAFVFAGVGTLGTILSAGLALTYRR